MRAETNLRWQDEGERSVAGFGGDPKDKLRLGRVENEEGCLALLDMTDGCVWALGTRRTNLKVGTKDMAGSTSDEGFSTLGG